MSDQIAHLFLAASVKTMQRSEDDINRCIDKLSDEQMWHRGADHENSIANLLLHLEGNLRQWFLHGIDGQPDVRQRDSEFTLSPSERCGEIRRRFAGTDRPSANWELGPDDHPRSDLPDCQPPAIASGTDHPVDQTTHWRRRGS